MTNTNEQLEALWQLSDEGKAEWWPKSSVAADLTLHLGVERTSYWTYGNEWFDPQHALDLVAAEAERWLLEKEWGVYKTGPYTKYVTPHPTEFDIFESLPEALAYEMKGTPTTNSLANRSNI